MLLCKTSSLSGSQGCSSGRKLAANSRAGNPTFAHSIVIIIIVVIVIVSIVSIVIIAIIAIIVSIIVIVINLKILSLVWPGQCRGHPRRNNVAENLYNHRNPPIPPSLEKIEEK